VEVAHFGDIGDCCTTLCEEELFDRHTGGQKRIGHCGEVALEVYDAAYFMVHQVAFL